MSADLADAPAASRTQVRFLLGAMMFFEYAVWGAWMPVFSGTLTGRGLSGVEIGNVYGALWLACIITPFIGGQLADRLMPAQRLLAILHGLAAIGAFVLAQQGAYPGFLLWTFLWALLFAPTLGITNAIALRHIDRMGLNEEQKEREFAWIRTAGTIGWIVAAFVLLFLSQNFASALGWDRAGKTGAVSEWVLTGGLGVVMAVLSAFLPHTPPQKGRPAADPLAFREAFSLFKTVPGFTVFMIVSFVAATEFQFFYLLSAPFLEGGDQPFVRHEQVGAIKSISQWAEIIALSVLLPYCLPRFGMRWCLLVGSFAWPLRYFIFAAGQPAWLVIASLGLHGFGYAFVLVVQQLYVDRVAPRDIRTSAQSLLNLVTLGLGNFLGSLFCGWVMERFTADKVTNWAAVFMVPAILTTLCALAYAATFRDPKPAPEEAR
jgi:nucleoside transporter